MTTASSSPTLQHCLAYADRIEKAVLRLNVPAGPLAELAARCATFRAACESIASNRGLGRVTIGFIGPRNAGKTTLASLLIRDAGVRAQLPVGDSADRSTRRVLWVGPERPSGLDPAAEAWIPCASEGLADTGFAFQVADVPGFNDRVAEVREAANRALNSASVKVLVVDERDLEALEVRKYTAESDGAVLVPVVNRAFEAVSSDIAEFVSELRGAIPHGNVTDPLVIPDFRQRDQDEATVLENARSELVAVLHQIIDATPEPAFLAGPQLRARLERFRAEVRRTAQAALPATATAMRALDEAETRLPREVLADTLGPERALRAVLRQRLRSLWLERTPGVLFPWRLTLSIAHLAWGALDRIPLMLMGSVPSLVSAAVASFRNLRTAAEFREATTQGLRNHLQSRAGERLAPLIQSLRDSLAVDLGRIPREDNLREETRVVGIAELQVRTAAAFDEAVERHAPGVLTSLAAGFLGFLLFWGIAGWPVYALYLDYFVAAHRAFEQARSALQFFPAPSVGMLFTACMLGLLPMIVWMALVASWVTRSGRVRACLREIRLAHEGIIQELLSAGLLRVDLSQGEWEACRILLADDDHEAAN